MVAKTNNKEHCERNRGCVIVTPAASEDVIIYRSIISCFRSALVSRHNHERENAIVIMHFQHTLLIAIESRTIIRI